MTHYDDKRERSVVADYHQRTKHHFERYAAGPETLDWTMQPNPFREFEGCPRVVLPLNADESSTPYASIFSPPGQRTPHAIAQGSLGTLLELSLGLSAWKQYGPDRWSLRCNPSSGNLHPTEAYVLCRGVSGLEDGVYHYVSRDHVLERRCRFESRSTPQASGLWLALSSVHWREAWKYGERAFRYCQLDVGHALGALRYAAGALGWGLKTVDGYSSDDLGELLGLTRGADFQGTEREDPDVLFQVMIPGHNEPRPPSPDICASWCGRANRLDAYPMYSWPVIDEVAAATAHSALSPEATAACHLPPLSHAYTRPASQVIRSRRSAQRFDGAAIMPAHDFYHLLDCLLPRAALPWDVWDFTPRLHPLLFVHRVTGLAPGLYALPRRAGAEAALRSSLRSDFLWARVAGCPDHIPLFHLAEADCRRLARTISCHQDIASTGCFSLGLLAEFQHIVRQTPWRYRQAHWEAGLIGQVLYLEAETAGMRGTGIGCFFDDAFHELIGLQDHRFQSLYHFTVGRAVPDARITTLAPYSERAVTTTGFKG